MKKLILTLLITGCTTLGISKSVIFNMTNGTKVYYLISEDNFPQMLILPDGNIQVNGQQMKLMEVRSFSISDTDYSGESGTIEGATGIVRIQEEQCLMKGTIQIFSADGKLIRKSIDIADLSILEPGIYLVSNGETTLKIQKK